MLGSRFLIVICFIRSGYMSCREIFFKEIKFMGEGDTGQ